MPTSVGPLTETRRFADRFLIASATAAGLVAFVIMLGMCGLRLSFAIP